MQQIRLKVFLHLLSWNKNVRKESKHIYCFGSRFTKDRFRNHMTLNIIFTFFSNFFRQFSHIFGFTRYNIHQTCSEDLAQWWCVSHDCSGSGETRTPSSLDPSCQQDNHYTGMEDTLGGLCWWSGLSCVPLLQGDSRGLSWCQGGANSPRSCKVVSKHQRVHTACKIISKKFKGIVNINF